MTGDMNRHYTIGVLLRFTLPTIAMMIFTSLYTLVDGLFVSNFVSSTALAAVNLCWPVVMMFSSVGLMMGTGGSALVAKTRGQGNDELANRYFTMCIIFNFILGILLCIIGLVVIEPLMQMLGAEGELLDMAVLYGRIVLVVVPLFALQFAFQTFFSAAGKPQLGFVVVFIAGMTNVVLDALFICVFGWGVIGGAVATALGIIAGGAIPVFYFAGKNSSLLHFRRTKLEAKPILKACVNGSSELVSNIAMSLIATLYNYQLMSYVGENGVAAYSVIGYTAMIFSAVFMGYALGASPLMSFQLGAGNKAEMRGILTRSLAFVFSMSVLMFLAGEIFAPWLSAIFVGYNQELLDFTIHAYQIYAFSFLLMGLPIYGSAFFTALNNGLISALIAFLRTLVFECGSVILLPMILGIEGIWMSVSIAELCAGALAGTFILVFAKRYGYDKQSVKRYKAETVICKTKTKV